MPEFQSDEQKTEKPTPKRKREAREKGQVARSREMNSLSILIAGTLVMVVGHDYILKAISRTFLQFLNSPHSIVNVGSMENVLFLLLRLFFPIVTPFFVGAVCAGLVSNFAQVGFYFVPSAMSPKLDRINPSSGFKRIFSWRSIFEAFKGFVKIGVLSLVTYLVFKPAIISIMSLTLNTNPNVIGMLVKVGGSIAIRALIVMMVVAALDYTFQYWQHQKSIRMSIKEVRDELKETEGDPHLRERIKSIQREMSRNRMLSEVKDSDVVITNPTDLAIAIKYTSEFKAPRVIAKGRKYLAQKIKEAARSFNVPVIENKPLAWALYKSCEVGGYVPVHLYKAVAEILAYVYSIGKKSALT